MNIGTIIYDRIQNVNISGFTTENVYPNVIAQGVEFPAVVYEIDRTNPERTKSGNSKVDTIAFNLYIFSNDYDQCNSISDAIRDQLDGYRSIEDDCDKIIFVASNVAYESASKVNVFIDTYEIRVKK